MKRQALQTTLTMSEMSTPVEQLITDLRVLDPSGRLLALYDLGIDGCAAGDLGQVVAVLHELIDSLDFQFAQIADSFHRLYTYCLDQARSAEFDRVAFVFRDLRDTLQRAVAESTPTPGQAAG